MYFNLTFSKVFAFSFLLVFLLQTPKQYDLLAQNSSKHGYESILKADTTLANQYFAKAEKLAKEAQYDSSTFYFQKASVLYEKAGTQSDDTKIWAKYVKCYVMISDNFRKKGKYEIAMTFVNKALQAGLDKLGKNHPDVARSYNSIGTIHHRKGEYEEALEYFEKSLVIEILQLLTEVV